MEGGAGRVEVGRGAGASGAAVPLSAAQAVEAAFGGAEPSGTLSGMLLVGAPRYQKRVLLGCGAVKVSLALSTFVTLFTHAPYEPADCAAPRADWEPPHRGSIAYEWSLCCGEQWRLAAISSTFFCGCLLGASLGGVLTDRVGRRTVVVTGAFANAVALGLSAVAPNPALYAATRFVSGAAAIATVVACFTLAAEWVPDGWRSALSGFLFSCSAVGESTMVAVAGGLALAGVFEWRTLTAFSAAVSLAIPLLVTPFLPESPRWLIAARRPAQALAVLRAAGLPNGVELAAEEETGGPKRGAAGGGGGGDGQEPAAKGATWEALRSPATHVMALLWFSASLAFYGISLSAAVLSRGMTLYASATLSAVSEVPSAYLSAWMLQQPWLGRRLSTTFLYAAGGACCAVLPLLPEGLAPVLAVTGKFFITSAFDGIYVYASEVFETTIRGSALGLCSSAARVGSILAPQAIALLAPEGVMLMFGCVALVSAVACRLVLPETRAGVAGGASQYAPLAEGEAVDQE